MTVPQHASFLVPAAAFGLSLLASPAHANTEAEPEPTLRLAEFLIQDPDGTPTFREALAGGNAWLSFRYRLEYVDQDGISDPAYASTLQTKLAYETLKFHNFSGLIEFNDVSVIGQEQFSVPGDPPPLDRPIVPPTRRRPRSTACS